MADLPTKDEAKKLIDRLIAGGPKFPARTGLYDEVSTRLVDKDVLAEALTSKDVMEKHKEYMDRSSDASKAFSELEKEGARRLKAKTGMDSSFVRYEHLTEGDKPAGVRFYISDKGGIFNNTSIEIKGDDPTLKAYEKARETEKAAIASVQDAIKKIPGTKDMIKDEINALTNATLRLGEEHHYIKEAEKQKREQERPRGEGAPKERASLDSAVEAVRAAVRDYDTGTVLAKPTGPDGRSIT